MSVDAVHSEPPPGLRLSLVTGILVAGLLLAGGLFFVSSRPTRWSATASVVVVPSPDVDPGSLASYYETLSRGQVVATFAELLRLRRFESTATRRLGLSRPDRKEVEVTILIVPDSAVITIGATGPTPALAERVADGVLSATRDYASGLSQPYTLAVLSPAKGSAEKTSPPRLVLAAVVALVSLVAALASQQGVFHLAMAWAVRPPVPALTPPSRSGKPGRGRGDREAAPSWSPSGALFEPEPLAGRRRQRETGPTSR
jgi:capsular polysaccharide biosynthesis protein